MGRNRRQKTVTFPKAIAAIMSGERMTRVEWDDPNTHILLADGLLKLHKANGTMPALLVSEGDLYGTDWVPVDERPVVN